MRLHLYVSAVTHGLLCLFVVVVGTLVKAMEKSICVRALVLAVTVFEMLSCV